MGGVVFVYDDEYKKMDFGAGHPMRGDRYEKAMNEFRNMGLVEKLEITRPKDPDDKMPELFHTPEYAAKVKKVSEKGKGSFGDEVPNFRGVYDAAMISLAGTITAAGAISGQNSADIAVNICGGWHHAFRDKGRGFCVFNDIAAAANYLRKEKNTVKIMALDYDAHHGDGTQKAFYSDPGVYTVSLHQDPFTLYPFFTGYKNEKGDGPGEGFNMNFPLPLGSGDYEFMREFDKVPEIIKNYKPSVLILQMGVDGSKECMVAGMGLTQKSYDYASKAIVRLSRKMGFKILALGGGGFVHPMLGRNWGTQIKNFLEQ